jgi:hypothetical protein
MKFSLIFGIAVLGSSIGIAGADELKPPPMKDGLWETHSVQTRQGKPVMDTSIKMCQSKELTKSTQAAAVEAKKKDGCTVVVSQPSTNTYVEEIRCAKGASAGSVTKVVSTYQGDTASHMEIHMQKGTLETATVMDMKYLESCPAGMQPGDAVMPDGTKISVGGK